MLADFPFPYENESIYSLLARFHDRSANIFIKQDFRDLFGQSKVYVATDLPMGIERLNTNFDHYQSRFSGSLINSHTPFNYYTNFLPIERRREIELSMLKAATPNKIHLLTGQVASTIKEHSHFLFCGECLKEDEHLLGETYWRVHHQFPGVFYCLKHSERLRVSNVLKRQRFSRLIAASFENCLISMDNRALKESLNSAEEKLLLQIAKESLFVNNNYIDISQIDLQKSYLQSLARKGYVSPNGRVSQRLLINDFNEFYGEKLLNLLQSLPNKNSESNWLSSVVRKPRKSFHPLRHILISIFLNRPFSAFLPSVIDEKYYPCRNPVSSHYLKKIALLKRKKLDKKKRLIGTVSCVCGYEYIIDIVLYDYINNGIGRVTKFGELWEKELIKMVEVENYSFRKAAKFLHADINTVIRMYRKLKKIQEDQACEKKVTYRDIEKDKQEWLRAQLLAPALSRSELRKNNAALFMRLYRSSKDWLSANSPPKTVIKRSPRIDWHKRDLEVLREIKEHVIFLKNNDQSKRMTIKEFGFAINNLSLLEKKLEKMPYTALFLKSIKEDFFEYNIKIKLKNNIAI